MAAVTVGLVLAGCGDGAATGPARPPTAATNDPAQRLNAAGFAAAVRAPGVVTINVHTPYEGEIPGTDRFIAFDRIAVRRSALPSRSARLAIYCRTGRMSAIAARTLARLGYRDVIELRGGMQAWEGSGRALRTSLRRAAG